MTLPKEDRLRALAEEYEECKNCILHRDRSCIVFGEGSVEEGSIMLIGEGPGEFEDREGFPFVGNSGQFLDELLLFYGSTSRLREMQDQYDDGEDLDYEELRKALCTDERLHYDNCVMCRPPDNRNPTRQELSACWDRLRRTIYVIDPIVIVALGKVAAQWLTKKSVKIRVDHGRFMEARIEGKHTELRYPVFVMFHPSGILREGDHNREGSLAWQTDGDLRTLFTAVDNARATLLGEGRPRRD